METYKTAISKNQIKQHERRLEQTAGRQRRKL